MLGRVLCLSVLLLEFAKFVILYQLARLNHKSRVSKERIQSVKLTLGVVDEHNVRVVPNLVGQSILCRFLSTDYFFELDDACVLVLVHVGVVYVAKLLEEVAHRAHVRLRCR